MNFIRRRLEKIFSLYYQNPDIKDFRNAGLHEINQTYFKSMYRRLNAIDWTPNIQKIPCSLEFTEFLQDCAYNNNVFKKDCKREDLQYMVENFIIEAFEEEELNNIQIEKDILLEKNDKTSLFGQVDFLMHNEKDKKLVAILIPDKSDRIDIEFGYYHLQNYPAEGWRAAWDQFVPRQVFALFFPNKGSIRSF